jgi:O-antigen ligase
MRGVAVPASNRHPSGLPVTQAPAAARIGAVPGVSPAVRWLVAAAIFIPISKIHGYFQVVAKLQIPLILAVSALLAVFLSTSKWRPADLGRHWLPKCLGGIFLIAMVGIPFGIYPGQSFQFLNEGLSRTMMLSVMVWAVARTPQGAAFIARAVLAACATAAILALMMGRVDNTGRLAGAFAYDANDIAVVAVIGIPLAVWYLVDQRNYLRVAMLVVLPLFFYLVYKSGSRGGFLGMIGVSAAFFLVGLGRIHPKVRQAGLAVGLLALVAVPFLPDSYMSSMKTITSEEDYNRTSPRGRINIWKRGIGYAVANPILGIGLANFGSMEGRTDIAKAQKAKGKGWKWSAAHNSLVQITAELGFIAGALFVTIILGSIINLVRAHRRNQGLDQLPAFLALSVVGYAITGFFLSWAYYDLTHVLFGLAGGVLIQYSSRNMTAGAALAAPAGPPRLPRRSPMWIPPAGKAPRAPDFRPQPTEPAESV